MAITNEIPTLGSNVEVVSPPVRPDMTPRERVAATSDRFLKIFVDYLILAALVVWVFELGVTPTVQYPGMLALATGLAAKFAIRMANIKLARVLIVALWTAFTIFTPAFLNGVRTPVLVNLPLLLLLTGWTMGRRALLLETIVLLSSITLYWQAEARGWFVMTTPLRSADIWFMTWFTVTTCVSLVIWFLVKNYEVNFSQEMDLQRQLTATLERAESANRKLTEVFGFNEKIIVTSPVPIGVYSADGDCVEANEAYAKMVGASRQDLKALNFNDITSWKTTGLLDDAMLALATGCEQRREFHCISSFGVEIISECRFLPVQINRENHLLIQFIDLAERKRLEDELRKQAFNDTLTGLPNRRHLLDSIARAMRMSKRQSSHAAVLFLDLNKFKVLNDTHGHDAGDHLLVEVAKRLKSVVRETDTVARLGGDEFVVLLEGLGAQFDQATEYVEVVGNKIRYALSEEYVLGEIRHRGSTSIGMKVFYGEGDPDILLKEADAAMYEAKKAEATMVLHG